MPKPLKHSRQVTIIHDPIIRGALKKAGARDLPAAGADPLRGRIGFSRGNGCAVFVLKAR